MENERLTRRNRKGSALSNIGHNHEHYFIDRLASYEDIGTVEEFEKLMKAKSEGRIAPCSCGNCKFWKLNPNEQCGGHCRKNNLNYAYIDGYCPFGERRDNK